jgi:hypothetical protein
VVAAAAGAAFLAWLGASIIVLSDGRRGLAVGLAAASAGLAIVAWQSSGPYAAVAVLVGGGAAALWQDRSGSGEWNFMPAGSTPRTLLCVVAALLALWVAASVITAPGASQRFAVLVVLALAGARVLSSDNIWGVRAAAAILALAVADAAALGGSSLWTFAAATVVAVGVSLIPMPKTNAA